MEPGTKLGPYEISEQLGAGGMGEVYLAQDTRLGRKVAIKVLPAEFASDPERLARFEQEARAAAALNHPHIAVVHDIGTEDGTHFMVQEYLEGDTLREPLQKGALPLKKALGLATEIAEALAAAHAAGIIHRDLKPENIFVTKEGHAKVLDFGLAKRTEVAVTGSPGGATQSPTMMGTVAGQVMGTAGYMAPEQVEGSEEIDHRADLFAFGCVLYEMVTAARAFAGSSLHDTLHRIGHEPARQLREIDPSLPVHLQRIVDKLLEKEPDDRYQHADDLAVDLRRLGRDIESGVLEREAPASPTEQRRSASGPRLALAVVGLAAVALAAAWILVPDQSASLPVLHADLSIPGLGLSRNMEGRPMSISADGRVIASHATVGGVELIAVLHLDTGKTRLLEIGSPSINEPVVSPDGEWIAYVDQSVYRVSTATGGSGRLKRDPAAG